MVRKAPLPNVQYFVPCTASSTIDMQEAHFFSFSTAMPLHMTQQPGDSELLSLFPSQPNDIAFNVNGPFGLHMPSPVRSQQRVNSGEQSLINNTAFPAVFSLSHIMSGSEGFSWE